MLLNILQCTGQVPTTKNYPTHNVDSGEVGEPHVRGWDKKGCFKNFYINTALDFNNFISLSVQEVFTEHLICGRLVSRPVRGNDCARVSR